MSEDREFITGIEVPIRLCLFPGFDFFGVFHLALDRTQNARGLF